MRRWLRDLRRGSFVAVLADAARRRRGIRLLARSGLIDGDHYRAQVGPVADEDVPAHYVDHGAAAGASPHPLFDPATYLAGSPAAARSAAAPFVEFLDRGCHRTTRPHPLFEPAVHLAAAPAAREHRFGAFGHFLAQRRATAPTSSPWCRGTTVEPSSYARDAARARARVADRRALAAVGETADAPLVAADELLAGWSRPDDGPVVAVVLPTFRRRAMVEEAIASVRAQSWPHWELVVVDDGGDDGTGELVEALAADDPRVGYVWQQNAGVASARNAGLRATTAPYVAYLDSDNTWEPRFLEVMVAELVRSGARAAHAASAIRFTDRVAYRATPAERARLLRGNHVDCITIVHERSLLDEVGGFDEGLVRFVDWDLLLRLTAATDVRYVPYLATSYEVGDAADHDRITTTASPGWRDVVQAKHLVDWAADEDPAPGTVTVVVALEGDAPEAPGWLHRLRGTGAEVVVADAGMAAGLATELELAGDLDPGLVVAAAPFPVGRSVARQLGLAAASGEVVVLVEEGAAVTGDEVRLLAERARATGGVVAPVVVDGSGVVRSAAVTMLATGDLLRWGVGRLPDDERLLPSAEGGPTLVEAGVVAVTAPLLRRLGGVDPLFVGGGGIVDLSLRALGAGAPVGVASDVVVVAGAGHVPGGQPTRHDRQELRQRWAGSEDVAASRPTAIGRRPSIVADPGGGVPRRWVVGVDRDERRRWSIVTCVPDRWVAPTWGDWHFARSLAAALRRLGEHVVVDTAISRSRASAAIDDVHVLLRGVNPVAPVPGATNLVWVISHVDDVAAHEAEGVDRVLAAGQPAARTLAARLGRDVETLLQCTDPTTFRPGRADEAPVAAELLFVGNTRGRPRPIVTDALAAGLDLTVVGDGWDGIVPADRVVATHVPNEELGAWYAAAGVVLADHWPDMRRHGVVANRLFDAVAAGATVVSDDVEGLGALFGDAVVAYSGGPAGLRAAVDTARGRRPGPGPAAAVGAGHTFDARARRLVAVVEELGHRS